MPPPSPPRHKNPLADDFRTAYAHHRAGRLERAEALYQKVLRKLPEHTDALNLLGLITLERGRPERAIQLISKAVQLVPGFAAAHSNLGNALMAAGRPDEAIASYRRAVALDPGFAVAHSNLGRALHAAGDFAEALKSCQAAATLDPALAQPHHIAAIVLRSLGKFTEAEAACRAALTRKPDDPAILRDHAGLLAELDRPVEALAILDRLLANHPDDATSQMARAAILYRMGEMPGAEAAYRRAATLAPTNAQAWNGLGRAERAQGRFADAETSFRRALAMAPDLADAHRNLGLIGRMAGDQAEMDRLAAMIERPETLDQDRVVAGFALGKLLDDADRFDDAFVRYQAANRLHRDIQAAAGKHFDGASLTAQVERITAANPAARLAALAGSDHSELPVFIVGMPRSGTSLVEQIAASHPQVFGAGELKELGRVTRALARFGVNEALEEILDPAAAGTYLAKLRDLGGAAIRVIDKMPDNLFLLGHVAALFPNARIIFCRRDPRDTCLSCYFTLFASGNLFSYDLADCARRHLECDRLAAHWRSALPNAMLTIDYEALVDDLEGESRKLIDFLGLDWDPACLSFYRTERTVVTTSSWQVRQPLYHRSVGRWRKYQPWIATTLQGLNPTRN